MSAQFGRERSRSLKSVVLSASFDRKLRAETKNARENLRLEKHQRDLELFKNNTEKVHAVEKNRVQSRMQSLRKNVLCRRQSNESTSSSTASSKMDSECIRLPKLPNSTETNGKLSIETCTEESSRSTPELQLLCEESGQNLTHFPIIENANSPRGERRILVKEHNESVNILAGRRRIRTQSHSVVEDLKLPLEGNGMVLKSTVQDCYGTPLSSRKTLLDVNSFQTKEFNRLSLRRRSLSTGDITLAERINSFLESIENPRIVDSTDSFSSSYSEDEKESI